MNRTCFDITVEPFGCPVSVFTDQKAAIESIKATFGKRQAKRTAKFMSGGNGYCHMHEAKTCSYFLMVLPAEYKEFVTWHEALHMTWFIMKVHGVEVDCDNHEMQTYLQEHIVKQIKRKVYGIKK